MKRLIQLSFLLFVLSILPGRAVSAENAQLPFRFMMPVIMRQISFSVTHVSPNFGRTLGVTQDPFNPNILYTYTFGSGVYKSIDYGATWFSSSKGMSYLVIQSFEADPINPGVLYAGTYGDVSMPYNGVYKSIDYGATWFQTGIMGNTWNGVYYKNPVVYVVAVDKNNPNIVFAGTRMKLPADQGLGGGGVFRSNNGGETWTPVNTGLPNDKLYVYDLILNPNQPGVVYATLHGIPPGGIYVSNNYGNSWQPFFNNWEALDGRALLLDPFDSTILYYGVDTQSGIWRYKNNRWDHIIYTYNVNVRALSADPYHQGRFYAGIRKETAGYPGLLRVDDNGNWNEVDSINSSYHLAFSPDQQTSYMAVDFDGVYKSVDQGLSWQISSSKLTGYSVTGMAVGQNDPNYLAAIFYGEGFKASRDGGNRWDNLMNGLETPYLTSLTMQPGNDQVMYVTTDQSGVYRTDDGGGHWSSFADGYPTSAMASLSSEAQEPFSAYTNRPIPEPDDDVQPDGPKPSNSMQDVWGRAAGNTLAVSPNNPGVVLVGTNGRGIYLLQGSTWTPTSLASGSVYSIWFDTAISGRVLAGVDAASGGVLVSSNYGQNWAPLNSGLAGRKVNSLVQSPYNANIYLAGTDNGVYASSNGGASWTLAGLSGQAVKSVTINNMAGVGIFYFAATDSTVYGSSNLPGMWSSIGHDFDDTGIQSMLRVSNGASIYILSRLGGIKRVQ